MKLTKHQFNAAVILGVLAGTALIAAIMAVGWFAKHHPLYFWAFVCAGCVCALIIKAAHAYGDIEDWFWRRKRDRIFKRSTPLFHIHTEELTHD
jgi:hypothetical protein